MIKDERGESLFSEKEWLFSGPITNGLKIEPDDKNSNNEIVVNSENDGIILGGKKLRHS